MKEHSLNPYLGNVYIGDYSNNRIRKVTVSTGIITTFAGTGTISYSGDNGQATSAALKYPNGISLDASGNSLHSNSTIQPQSNSLSDINPF